MRSLEVDHGSSFITWGFAGAGVPFLIDFIRTAARALTDVIYSGQAPAGGSSRGPQAPGLRNLRPRSENERFDFEGEAHGAEIC
jgi:hypothetical protein